MQTEVDLTYEKTRAIPVSRAFEREKRSLLDSIIAFLRTKPLGTFGAFLVLGLVLTAILANIIAPYSYVNGEMLERLRLPSAAHWLGTDSLGRDLLTRVIWGARISMYVGLGAVGLGTTSATVIGVVSGYYGGKVDMVVQRVVDAWMSFPPLVILLSIIAILGPGLINIILVIGMAYAFAASRIIRSAVLSTAVTVYVEAARSIGCSNLRIITRHVLPNVMAPIIIIATLGLGNAILLESSLSFLGYGVPPPAPTWGSMLSGSNREWMYVAPLTVVWPGLAIMAAVLGFNMLGDALRDVLDPRLRGSK